MQLIYVFSALELIVPHALEVAQMLSKQVFLHKITVSNYLGNLSLQY